MSVGKQPAINYKEKFFVKRIQRSMHTCSATFATLDTWVAAESAYQKGNDKNAPGEYPSRQ